MKEIVGMRALLLLLLLATVGIVIRELPGLKRYVKISRM
ncbi:MAG: DUF6893 family small protein [Thermoleophilaceae bacterium]